jgi:hypothetical protein
MRHNAETPQMPSRGMFVFLVGLYTHFTTLFLREVATSNTTQLPNTSPSGAFPFASLSKAIVDPRSTPLMIYFLSGLLYGTDFTLSCSVYNYSHTNMNKYL